jgi:hypothetical protein
MKRDQKLEKATDRILDTFLEHLEELPEEERDMKMSAFNDAANRLETRAKPQRRQRS